MSMEDAVAVIGMACRFPGSGSTDEFWRALRAGLDGISRHRPGELVAQGLDPGLVRRPDFVAARGVLPGAYSFDWPVFGYSRAEAASIDPQQRVFLECASAALDDAGLDPARFPGWVGVYGGADWVSGRAGEPESLAEVIGRDKDFLTTRVAYKLGLKGPAITVQTACSTGLTAVHLATQSLLAYECDAALAGGVAVGPPTERGYLYREGGILSPDGFCRPFDQNAAGTVPSEGVGIVVLKRAEDALRDHDRIAALIVGSAVNNDGGEKVGYTAPGVGGQRDVIRLAHKVAGVEPADLRHIEAHGTATRMGDPVEVQALTDVFAAAGGAPGKCLLGAVKSNIGHTGAASGVAGLIKTVLMLEHGELVPTLHYTGPNPLLRLEETPFRVCTRSQPWPGERTPLAAVSAFGVGGTNVHVIAQAPPRRTRTPASGKARLLTLSAASPDGLERFRSDIATHLRSRSDAVLPEVARTLAERRRFPHRRAVVATEAGEAARLLENGPDVAANGSAKVAFLFPGQGTLRHAAGAAAYELLPGFRTVFDDLRATLAAECGLDLSPVVEPGHPPDWYGDTVHQQLGLFALGYALGRQLGDWGVTPVAMLGNSIGEYPAAALAGVWAPGDAAVLVHARARAMRAGGPGRMVAVDAGADEVAGRIGGDVKIAVYGPGRVVLSGPDSAMSELLSGKSLAGLEVRELEVRRAFHSPEMRPAARSLMTAVEAAERQDPRLPLISSVTGGWADSGVLRDAAYWAGQVVEPVRLDTGFTTLLGADSDLFVELGPGVSMLAGLRRHEDWRGEYTTVPMLGRPAEDGERSLLRALGTLWERGVDVDLEAARQMPRPLVCSLPAQPFRPLEPDTRPVPEPGTASVTVPRPKATAVPASGDPVRAAVARLWCSTLGTGSVTDEDDFFALGGESLMVVGLLSKVREATGATASVADFVPEPTFGNLLRLARHTESQGGRVVTLAKGARRGPLFLVADSLATVAGYRSLAGELAGDRTVHGLEPALEVHKGVSIEDIAAAHAETVSRLDPAGPYTLGGWSFGAVVAHETARQLSARGGQVDMVVCLDGFPPPRFDPRFGLARFRLRAETLLGTGMLGREVRGAPALRRLLTANLRALGRYRPGPLPCPAVVFTAGNTTALSPRHHRHLSTLYEGGIRVVPVAGDHWSMLAEPHVTDLAAKLREVLPDKEGVPIRG